MERGCSTVVCLFIIFTTIHLWAAIHANVEVDALIALKNALSDPDNVLQSWVRTSTDDHCTWFQVSCDIASNKVNRIDLGNSNLSGHLVPELQDLTELQTLNLYSNQINGPIPTEFGNLANLETLSLQNNSLSGPIPKELGNLTNLKFIWLNDNKFSGPLPDAIENLIPQLKQYDFSNNPDLCGKNTDNPSCP